MKKRMTAILIALMMALVTVVSAFAVSEIDAQKADTYYNLASSYLNAGDNYDKAIEYLDKVLSYCGEETSPDLYADLYMKKAIAYTAKGDNDSTLENLDKVLSYCSAETPAETYAEIYSRKATALIQKDDYDAAMEVLNQELQYVTEETLPDAYAEAHLKIGCVHILKKEYDQGLAELDEVLRLYPTASDVFIVKAQAYSELEDYVMAAENLEKYIEYSGDIAQYEALNDLYTKAGDAEKAQAALDAFNSRLDTANQDFEAANAKMEAGEYEEAIQMYTAYLQDTVNGLNACYNIGICYLRQEKYAEALPYFTTCRENSGSFEGLL